MKKDIVLLDLFSGSGGFAKGFIDAGYKIKRHLFSEIDKHAIANYKHNFKKAEYVGSVTDVRGGKLKPDVITFGSPCQDFSIAGKGDGLEGSKSHLIMEAIRIVSEERPSVFIWENVKGAFSSNNGADFWAIIRAFADIGDYRLEWQLLNTLWLLPQNRERIYLVGHLRGKSEPKVFPIGKDDIISSCTHKKSKGEGKRIQIQPDRRASTLTQRAAKMGVDDNYIRYTDKVLQVNPSTESGGQQPYEQNRVYLDNGVVPALRTDGRVQVKAVITPERKEKRQNGRRFKEDGDPMFTLNTQDIHGVQIGDTIRRLTPVEFERLQGFPDQWTKYGIYDGVKKEISDTQRYKLMGNAVTVEITELIASRL